MISVTFVVFPIAFIAAFLAGVMTPSPPLTYVLGIPLGLLGVSLGLINIFSERSDFNALAPATAILLLTILFGGTISGLLSMGRDRMTQMPQIPFHSALIGHSPSQLLYGVTEDGTLARI